MLLKVIAICPNVLTICPTIAPLGYDYKYKCNYNYKCSYHYSSIMAPLYHYATGRA